MTTKKLLKKWGKKADKTSGEKPQSTQLKIRLKIRHKRTKAIATGKNRQKTIKGVQAQINGL